jgi:hypothetical protein
MSRLGMVLVLLLVSAVAHAQQIAWSSDDGKTNLTSNGSNMDGTFQFELGVFEGTFQPELGNMAQWATNWRPVQQTNYDTLNSSFAADFSVEDNDPPFTAGKPAYVWGWRVDSSGTEWILFRNASWTWPDLEDTPAFTQFWEAVDATAIIGEIDPDGSPFLMKSAMVRSYNQWRTAELAGSPLDGPNQDPDQDGTVNLLEFVFGSNPMIAGPRPQTPVSLVAVGADRFLQITIPRRIDHIATLVVEVSSDLKIWNSGPEHTATVSNDVASLVVRDLTPLSSAAPRRFIRLRAVVP